MFKNWALDVTLFKEHGHCFVPVERGGVVVWGMNMIQDECPGNLVAVVHEGGQKEVEEWIEKNPKWHEKYSKKE